MTMQLWASLIMRNLFRFAFFNSNRAITAPPSVGAFPVSDPLMSLLALLIDLFIPPDSFHDDIPSSMPMDTRQWMLQS
jgi:hypothetical protein